jgi:hypothetical protein
MREPLLPINNYCKCCRYYGKSCEGKFKEETEAKLECFAILRPSDICEVD